MPAEQRILLTEAENGTLNFRRGDEASVVKDAVSEHIKFYLGRWGELWRAIEQYGTVEKNIINLETAKKEILNVLTTKKAKYGRY